MPGSEQMVQARSPGCPGTPRRRPCGLYHPVAVWGLLICGQARNGGAGSSCATAVVVEGWQVQGKDDEGDALRDLAEVFPTLKELRLANPPGAGKFLTATRHQSENWPTASLIDGYLDALP